MKIAVIANEQLKEEFLLRKTPAGTEIYFTEDLHDTPGDSEIVFDLLYEYSEEHNAKLKKLIPKPVFINAVSNTLASIKEPFIRINAWPTFLNRNIIETTVLNGRESEAENVFKKLEWKFQFVPDITGMITPRITGAIINEAYQAFADGVSSKEEIDIAMKLGTNYPYGPFEWGNKIGMQRVKEMFMQLSKQNNLYKDSILLTNKTIV